MRRTSLGAYSSRLMLMLCAGALAGSAAAVTTPEIEVISNHGCGDEAVFVSGEYLDFTVRLLNTVEQASVTVQVHITMGNGQKYTLAATLGNSKREVTFSGMRQTYPVPPSLEVGVISVNAVLPGGNTTPVTCTFTTVDSQDATPLPTITTLPSATPTPTTMASSASPTTTETVAVTGTDTPLPSLTPTSTQMATSIATDTSVVAPTHTPSPTPPGMTSTPTATASALVATVTLGPTATPTPPACVGDCDGNAHVSVDELLAMVTIALGNAEVSKCMVSDGNDDQQITIDEILAAVSNALNGCRAGVLGADTRTRGGP